MQLPTLQEIQAAQAIVYTAMRACDQDTPILVVSRDLYTQALEGAL